MKGTIDVQTCDALMLTRHQGLRLNRTSCRPLSDSDVLYKNTPYTATSVGGATCLSRDLASPLTLLFVSACFATCICIIYGVISFIASSKQWGFFSRLQASSLLG